MTSAADEISWLKSQISFNEDVIKVKRIRINEYKEQLKEIQEEQARITRTPSAGTKGPDHL